MAAAAWTMSSCSGSNKADAADSDTVKDAVEAAADTASSEALADSVLVAKSGVADATVLTTGSGLKYVIVKEGTGAPPTAEDAVTVHYTGMLTDGTVFDSSITRGEPATFPLGRVIPGWTEGLQLMKEGGKTVFYIPSALAYGDQGIPGVIPGGSDLVFEVELLKVEK